MKLATSLRGLAIGAALACPAVAQAGAHTTMTFTGVVSQGATGTVSPYLSGGSLTSFAGQPMSISVGITQAGGETYVDAFSAQWSDQTYDLPYIKGYSGTGLPNTPENQDVFGFISTVDLNSNGGSVFITPTALFVASTDGDFTLSFNFTYSTPHDPFTTFSDNDLSGGGTFDAFFTFLIDPVLGPYDVDSAGPFTLSSVSATGSVPEPQVWALMILGFGAAGAVLRRQRGLASASA